MYANFHPTRVHIVRMLNKKKGPLVGKAKEWPVSQKDCVSKDVAEWM